MMMIEEKNLRELENILKERLVKLCREAGIKKAISMDYSSMEVVDYKVRKEGRTYNYVQLKLVGEKESRSLKTWKKGEEPRQVLWELVKTYRALKHLGHLKNYLSMFMQETLKEV